MKTFMQYSPAVNTKADEEMFASLECQEEQARTQSAGMKRRAVLGVSIAISAGLVVAAAGSMHGHSIPAVASPTDSVGLQAIPSQPAASAWQQASGAAPSAVPPELLAAKGQLPQLSGPLDTYFDQGMGYFPVGADDSCPEGEQLFQGLCFATCASLTNGTAKFRQSPFECCDFDRSQSMTDAGCQQGEELFNGMCYRTCALLTAGKAPYRTSAWTCCADEDVSKCGVTDVKHDVGFCSGYSVSGDGQSCPKVPGHCVVQKGFHLCGGFSVAADHKSCPHTPGLCASNEEIFLNQCYKKCSLLSNGEKPHRMSPWTCCETNSFSCINPANSDTSNNFNVGGGAGDSDPSTEGQSHPPVTSAPTAATA